MSLLYLDQFESMSNGSLLVNNLMRAYSRDFTLRSGNGANDINVVSGSISSKQLRIIQGSRANYSHLTWNGDVATKVITVGFAFATSSNENNKVSSYIPDNVNTVIVAFSTDVNSRLKVGSDWSVSLGDVTTQPNTLRDSSYSYIEVTVDFNTGDFTLYIDGITIGNGNMLLSTETFIRLGNAATANKGQYYFYDDIYILDDSGEVNNKALGPIRVKHLPLLESTVTNFTPIGAETNLGAVSGPKSNSNTYNRSNPLNNNGDMYKVDTSSIPEDASIIAVQQKAMCAKTDYSKKKLSLVMAENLTELESSSEALLLLHSSDTALLAETSPEGGEWDILKLSSVEFGYRVNDAE